MILLGNVGLLDNVSLVPRTLSSCGLPREEVIRLWRVHRLTRLPTD